MLLVQSRFLPRCRRLVDTFLTRRRLVAPPPPVPVLQVCEGHASCRYGHTTMV